jgi:hypothetical protein
LNPYNHGIECKEQVAPHQPEGLKQSVVIWKQSGNETKVEGKGTSNTKA